MTNLTFNEILGMDFQDKTVLIIGAPASGKTHLSKELELLGHFDHYIHTDDFIQYGFEDSMYKCLEHIESCRKGNILIEGVQGYRLLRKGVQLDSFYPDIVIEMSISAIKTESIYKNERDEKKLKHLKSFAKSCEKILSEYLQMPNKNKPLWIKLKNEY